MERYNFKSVEDKWQKYWEENKTFKKFDLTFSPSLLCINKILVAKLIDDSITRNSILYPNNKLWICLTAKCQIALTSLTQCTLPNIQMFTNYHHCMDFIIYIMLLSINHSLIHPDGAHRCPDKSDQSFCLHKVKL